MAINRENKPIEKKIFEEETKNGMNVVTNMNGEERANNKLMARGITFKELKNLKGNTITEKLRNLGVKNFPKNITIEKAIELINKKRAN